MDQTIVDKQINGEVPRGAFIVDSFPIVHRQCKSSGDMRNKDVFVHCRAAVNSALCAKFLKFGYRG